MSFLGLGSRGPRAHVFSLKRDVPLERRKHDAAAMRAKYPERVPVVVERATGSSDIPDIDKKKFLVPLDLTVGQFVHVIRKRIQLKPENAVFVFVNGTTLPPTAALVSTVYQEEKDPEDGFLYMTYTGENVFG